MYIVVIAWMYVAVMMAVAEAASSNGSLLGAAVTLVFYGLLPCGLIVYILGTPARKRAIRAREAALPGSIAPDGGSETPADAVAPVRKET